MNLRLASFSPRLTRSAVIIAASTCVFALAGPMHAAPAAVNNLPGKFVSPSGYSLTPPTGWKKNTSGMMGTDVAFSQPPKNRFATNIIVLPTPLPSGYTIQRVGTEWVAQHKPLQLGYAQVSHSFATVGNLPAYRSVETSQSGTPSRAIKAEEYGVLYKGCLFQFVYTALPPDFPGHLAAFEAMIRTVRWR